MAHLPTRFDEFLQRIRPDKNDIKAMKKGHEDLRALLNGNDLLKPLIVSVFLQGSYRRSTALRPTPERRADVDIVVVTNLSRFELEPKQAQGVFEPFLKEHYKDAYEPKGRSFGITLPEVDLDLVITSAPSEMMQKALRLEAARAVITLDEDKSWRLNEEWRPPGHISRWNEDWYFERLLKAAQWKTEPLWIPNCDSEQWEQSNPLAQIVWTHEKNRDTNGHYVNVVKALKWWRLLHPKPKHPKGYPLEHLIGECCPDGLDSIAKGVRDTLVNIRREYAGHVLLGETPVVADPERTCGRNVLERVTAEDFAAFHAQVSDAAELAEKAYAEEDPAESERLWRELFGEEFGSEDDGSDGGDGGGSKNARAAGYTAPSGYVAPPRGRFA